MRFLAIVAAALALSACSIGKDIPVAEAAAVSFHQQLDAGKFVDTWQNAAPDLRAVTPKDKWLALLDAVHRKLGKFKSAKTVGWNDNFNNGRHFIVLNQQAEYERGSAQEQFVYRIDAGKAALAGYHVNSEALILN
jgi:hypothetical protein